MEGAQPPSGPAEKVGSGRGWGCVAVGVLFAVTAIFGWLLAILLYGVLVEQWAMIRVRREFSYDWVFLYAPLFAMGCGGVVALWASRRASAARLTLLILLAGTATLVGGIALFGLGGLI